VRSSMALLPRPQERHAPPPACSHEIGDNSARYPTNDSLGADSRPRPRSRSSPGNGAQQRHLRGLATSAPCANNCRSSRDSTLTLGPWRRPTSSTTTTTDTPRLPHVAANPPHAIRFLGNAPGPRGVWRCGQDRAPYRPRRTQSVTRFFARAGLTQGSHGPASLVQCALALTAASSLDRAGLGYGPLTDVTWRPAMS